MPGPTTNVVGILVVGWEAIHAIGGSQPTVDRAILSDRLGPQRLSTVPLYACFVAGGYGGIVGHRLRDAGPYNKCRHLCPLSTGSQSTYAMQFEAVRE